jgi:rubrerythrin
MFGDISNDENNHWNPFFDWAYKEDEEEVQEVSPSVANMKRKARAVLEIPKKPKSSTALAIQEQIAMIVESASTFALKKEGGVTIKEVMDHVLECGADYGTNEHSVATQLFVKKDQREMFLTLPTNKIRFDWLTRMYNKFEK